MPEIPDIPEELPLADAVEATPRAAEAERLEIAAAEDVAEIHANAKEETPVLDVHMPHATHTWKDFFIHLGTITAGLLIAISLEQSVEKLHHLHQRHELEASLRAEAAVNKERAEVNFVRYDDEMTWLLGLHEDIQKMLATEGKAEPSVPDGSRNSAGNRWKPKPWASYGDVDRGMGHGRGGQSAVAVAGRRRKRLLVAVPRSRRAICPAEDVGRKCDGSATGIRGAVCGYQHADNAGAGADEPGRPEAVRRVDDAEFYGDTGCQGGAEASLHKQRKDASEAL